jgi:hypothetical protein
MQITLVKNDYNSCRGKEELELKECNKLILPTIEESYAHYIL